MGAHHVRRSGGYAGAKATIRFITSYAAGESQRASFGIRFVSVLPQLTPATELGAAATAAYAAREGLDLATYLDKLDRRSPWSRSARPSPAWPPARATITTPTCSRPKASAQPGRPDKTPTGHGRFSSPPVPGYSAGWSSTAAGR
jgi:hypothetical protein